MVGTIKLRQVRDVDALDWLSGPLRRARLIQLAPRRTETLVADEQEHVLFTLSGSGSVASTSTTVPLRYGVSVGVPFRSSVTVEGGPAGLEFFVVSLAVPANTGGAR